MRGAFLVLIILCEIVIALTRKIDVDKSALSLVTTLMVVVIMAFMISGPLQRIKSLSLARNYMVSGIVGVIVGIIFYTWVGDHLDYLLEWLKNYGLFILLLIIFVSATVLYFKGPSSHKKEEKVEPLPEPKLSSSESLEGNTE